MFLSISHPWNPMMNLTSPKCSAIFWWMIPNIPPKRKKNKTKKTSPLLSFRPAEPAKKMVDFCTLIRFMSSGPGFFAEQMSALGKKSRNNKLISNGKKKTGPEIVRHLVLRVPEREGKGESWPSFQELTFFSIIFWKVQKSPNKTRCHFCGVLEMFQVDRTPGFQKSSQKMILEYTVYIICYIFWGKWFRYTIFAPHPTLCFPNRFSTPRHRKQERCKRQRHRGLNQRHLGKNVWGWKPCSPKMEVDVVDVSENRGISPNHPMD